MNGTTVPVLLTGGMAVLARAVHGAGPTNTRGGSYGKIILGTFVIGAMLSALQGRIEEVATAIAWVAAITSILVNGQTVFAGVSRIA